MKKRLIIILASAVVLAAVIVVFIILKNRPEPEPTFVDTDDPDKVAIARFDENLIEYMEINSPNGTLRLQKDGEEWTILDQPNTIKLRESKVDDLIYSFSRMYSEKIVDEEPGDLSIYGLVPPAAVALCRLTDGSEVEFYLGDRTSARNTYYLMMKDDPRLYAVWMNHGSHFNYSLADMRDERLPVIDLAQTIYMKINVKGRTLMELMKHEDLPEEINTLGIASMFFTEPYPVPKAVPADKLDTLWNLFGAYEIEKYVDDNPRDLSAYGLDPPVAEYIHKDQEETRHLLFGNKDGEYIYFMNKGDPAVYAMKWENSTKFMDARPFDYIDKFAFLINIEDIHGVSLQGLGKEHKLSIDRQVKEEEEVAVYLMDGEEKDEKIFKSFYQSLIAIMLDAEYDGKLTGTPEVEVVFFFRKPTEFEFRIGFVPYNSDFYALVINGQSNFLVSRTQVKQMMADLDRLKKGERSQI